MVDEESDPDERQLNLLPHCFTKILTSCMLLPHQKPNQWLSHSPKPLEEEHEANDESERKARIAKSIAPRYQGAAWSQKGRIFGEFVAATGYARKHAIAILILARNDDAPRQPHKARKRRYDAPVREALVTLWRAANGICAKRLVPFLPNWQTSCSDAGT